MASRRGAPFGPSRQPDGYRSSSLPTDAYGRPLHAITNRQPPRPPRTFNVDHAELENDFYNVLHDRPASAIQGAGSSVHSTSGPAAPRQPPHSSTAPEHKMATGSIANNNNTTRSVTVEKPSNTSLPSHAIPFTLRSSSLQKEPSSSGVVGNINESKYASKATRDAWQHAEAFAASTANVNARQQALTGQIRDITSRKSHPQAAANMMTRHEDIPARFSSGNMSKSPQSITDAAARQQITPDRASGSDVWTPSPQISPHAGLIAQGPHAGRTLERKQGLTNRPGAATAAWVSGDARVHQPGVHAKSLIRFGQNARSEPTRQEQQQRDAEQQRFETQEAATKERERQDAERMQRARQEEKQQAERNKRAQDEAERKKMELEAERKKRELEETERHERQLQQAEREEKMALEELRHQKEMLEGTVHEMEQQRANVLADLTELRGRIGTEEDMARERAENAAVKLRTKKTAVEDALQNTNVDEVKQKKEIDKLWEATQNKLNSTRGVLNQFESDEEACKQQLEAVAKRLDAITHSKQDVKKDLEVTFKRLEDLRGKAANVKLVAENQRNELTKHVQDLSTQLDDAEHHIKKLKQEAEAKRVERSNREKELTNQLSEVEESLKVSKGEVARTEHDLAAHVEAMPIQTHPPSNGDFVKEAVVPVAGEDDDSSKQVVFKDWPKPDTRKPAVPHVRRVKMTNLSPHSTYTDIQGLVWGGPVEAIVYDPGSTWAWVLFKNSDDCKNYAIDTEGGIKLEDKPTVVVEKAAQGEPMADVLRTHFDNGASRCVRTSNFPPELDLEAWKTMAGANGRKVESVRIGKTKQKMRIAEVRFVNVYDALKFKTELGGRSDMGDWDVDFASDPCEKHIGPH